MQNNIKFIIMLGKMDQAASNTSLLEPIKAEQNAEQNAEQPIIPDVIKGIISWMTYKCGNPEQVSVLLISAKNFMEENSRSKNADKLCCDVEKIFDIEDLFLKIPIKYRDLYKKILKTISFVSSKLARDKPKRPPLFLVKWQRLKRESFFHHGFSILVSYCFYELISIVPESPWTEEDAALFLRTLESICPVISTLFTMVFNNLMNCSELQKEFSKPGAYLSHPTYFSNSVFLSLSKVVRPNSLCGDPKEIIQSKYKLMHHFRFPVSSVINE
jgi:hypothetical protein